MSAPIFVGGSGRSGTTVLGRLLEVNPAVALLPLELRVHCDPGGLTDAAAGRVPRAWLVARLRGYWRERTALGGEPRGLTRLLAADAYDAAVDAYAAARAPRQAGRELVETLVAAYHDRDRWVDTSPPNCAAAEGLQAMFPDARFVHVVRSGLDVACSYRAQRWAPDDLADCLMWWGDRTAASASGMRHVQATTLRLETLVSRPDAELTRLAEGLGLRAEDFPAAAAARVLSAERANVGRWRAEIPRGALPLLLAIYLAECRRTMRAGLPQPPADLDAAQAEWRALPAAVRAPARVAAAARRAAWRTRRGRPWNWRPGPRLRARARLERRLRP